MILLSLSSALACDGPGLDTLAARDDLDPASTAAALVPLCPNPALKKALKRVPDPWEDVSLASQTLTWNRACPGGLDALPSGFGPATQGERARLYRSCELDPTLVTLEEFVLAPGPPVTAIVLAHSLPTTDRERRRTLVRALLGVREPAPPVADEGATRPLDEPAKTAPVVKLAAKVAWPPNAKDPYCVVDVEVQANGRFGEPVWASCEDEWRAYVLMALEGTLFEPATVAGLPTSGFLRMTFGPKGVMTGASPSTRAPSEPEASNAPEAQDAPDALEVPDALEAPSVGLGDTLGAE